MAVVKVHRIVFGGEILLIGTQYISGSLSFTAPTTITLDNTIYTGSGTYALFDYNSGSFPGGQSELNTYVSVTHNGSLNASSLTDNTGAKQITIVLS
jgi:hypothetical protein